MRLHPRRICILRRDGDAHRANRQALRECGAELVLRGDDGRGHAGPRQGRKDGRSASAGPAGRGSLTTEKGDLPKAAGV